MLLLGYQRELKPVLCLLMAQSGCRDRNPKRARLVQNNREDRQGGKAIDPKNLTVDNKALGLNQTVLIRISARWQQFHKFFRIHARPSSEFAFQDLKRRTPYNGAAYHWRKQEHLSLCSNSPASLTEISRI
jgi:hypothetical protein